MNRKQKILTFLASILFLTNLVNESPSLLVFERQSGFGQTFLMHMAELKAEANNGQTK
jgi:hypothetical protein